ncbi:unnamed protein product [Linum trigynum]|uniref:Uncharacterized protein n=1 Tax=Linum trigynum TaxID=586398 RepID=A0AAV2FU60_9ROSI
MIEGKEEEDEGSQPESFDSMVGDLLSLLYFAALFDVKLHNDFTGTMLSRTQGGGADERFEGDGSAGRRD